MRPICTTFSPWRCALFRRLRVDIHHPEEFFVGIIDCQGMVDIPDRFQACNQFSHRAGLAPTTIPHVTNVSLVFAFNKTLSVSFLS
jgi:hypothetical protein